MEPSVMAPSVIDEVVNLVFSVVAPILAAVGTAVLVKLFAKLGIELDLTRKAALEQQLGNAVALTEEWAAVRIKNGIPITAQQKAEHYIGVVADKLPHVTPDEATAVAKTILGRFKVAAAGSLSDLSQAVASK